MANTVFKQIGNIVGTELNNVKNSILMDVDGVKVRLTNVENNVISDATRIATLETLLLSDDINLDTIQEIVNFVKANRSTLEGLTLDWASIQNKPLDFTPTEHDHNTVYYTKLEVDTALALVSAAGGDWNTLLNKPSDFIPSEHDHGLIYYTKTEVDLAFANLNIVTSWELLENKPLLFPAEAHTHDDLYYTKAEVDIALTTVDVSSKADVNHTHDYMSFAGGAISGNLDVAELLTQTSVLGKFVNNADETAKHNMYWNTLGGLTPTYINDDAAIAMSFNTSLAGTSVTFKSAPQGINGELITWTNTLEFTDTAIKFKGNDLLTSNDLSAALGWSADTLNTPETLVQRDLNGDFSAGKITADLIGNASTSSKLKTGVSISLSGDVTGSANFDGSENIIIDTIFDGSNHTHTLANITDWPTTISPIMLGYLQNVTSDIQSQLDTKESKITGAISTLLSTDLDPSVLVVTDTFGKLTGLSTINISDLGYLSNVTSDIQTQLNSKESKDNKGMPNGYVGLDSTGKVPTSHLPAYVDEVLEFPTAAQFPQPGITGKIYVSADSNSPYRWTGTSYLLITSGAVSSVAGKTGVIILNKNDVGLGNVDNTTDVSKNVLSATKLTTARNIALTGDVTGTVSFNGSTNVSITTTVVNDSHEHTFNNLLSKPTTLGGYGITDATPVSHIGSNGTSHAVVTTSTNGFMSSTDKSKLDGIAVGATKYTHPTSGVTAGTYSKLTVDANGHVTSGANLVAADIPNLNTSKLTAGILPIIRGGTNNTTFTNNNFLVFDGTSIVSTGYNVNSFGTRSSSSVTFNSIGGSWYRIATTGVGIGRASGEFRVDWAVSGHHGSARFTAGCHYGHASGVSIQQHEYSFYGSGGINAVRVVYHQSYTGNYAYVEVRFAATLASVYVNVSGIDLMGWAVTNPSTGGGIPAGYNTYTHTLVAPSSINAGTFTKVTYNNEGRITSGTTLVASDIPNLDASKITSGTLSLSTATFSSTINANGGLSQDGQAILNGTDTWLRTYGNTGWYSESYGGGLCMTDSTWIRTYGSKSFYHNTGNMRTDGTLQVGSSGSTLNIPNGGTATLYGYNILHLGNNQGISPWTPSFSNVSAPSTGTFVKTSGSTAGWDAHVCSNQGYVTNVFCKFSAGQTNTHIMAGLNADPFNNTSYNTLDFAIYMATGSLLIYESGAHVATFGTYSVTDVFTVHYDGVNVRYYQNNTLLRTVGRGLSTTPLYFDTSFHELNASITNVGFGSNGYNNANALNGMNATSGNNGNTVISRDGSGNFSAGTITATLSGNSSTATKWATARTLTLNGDITGSVSMDGTSNVTLTTVIANDSHEHTFANLLSKPTTIGGYGITDAAPLSHVGTKGTSHAAVTTTVNGFMIASDKSKLDGIATSANNYVHPTSPISAGTYTKITVDALGHTTSGTTLVATDIPNLDTAKLTTGILPTSRGGTGNSTVIQGGIAYGSTTSKYDTTAAGTSGYILKSNGTSAPTWTANDMTSFADETFKKSVRVATTVNITLSAIQTIDGISVVAGDRVLVKNQTTQSENGIYIVSTAAWTRSIDSDSSTKIATAIVGVDSGSVNGGKSFTTNFKTTDTLSTTAMVWFEVISSIGGTFTGLLTAPSYVLGNSRITDTSVTLSTVTQTAMVLGASGSYRSAELLVQITEGTKYHTTKINVIHDGTTAHMTEYATMFTSTSLATFDVNIASGNINLLATGASATARTYKIQITLINI